MESLLIWGIALIAAALVLTVIEVFVPSAGLIAIIAGVLGVVGVVCLFRYETLWGVGGALALVVLAPMIFAFGLKLMPSTPIGRKLLFGESGEDPVRADTNARSALIGVLGECATDLRPVGSVMIDGERLSASSEGTSIIPAGTKVKVVAVDGPNIRVRPV